ncbi:MAG: hypothetical protein JWP91_640 [Fibrobacteres bacterium]|nr:hypothetical protein [Fibrobacterota bacterium]
MKFPSLVSLCLIALSASSVLGWMGIKPKGDHARPGSPALLAPPADQASSRKGKEAAGKGRPADTAYLSRQVMSVRAGTPGRYLGTLDGVRCFNCAPDLVLLNLGDSSTREAAVISLRIEVWNAIERPVRDRRMFDYDNRCFYFGYKEIDTAFVGGEWTEIRVQDVPCYPYMRRMLQSPLASGTPSGPAPVLPEGAAPSAAGNPSWNGVQDSATAPIRSALHEEP